MLKQGIRKGNDSPHDISKHKAISRRLIGPQQRCCCLTSCIVHCEKIALWLTTAETALSNVICIVLLAPNLVDSNLKEQAP